MGVIVSASRNRRAPRLEGWVVFVAGIMVGVSLGLIGGMALAAQAIR